MFSLSFSNELPNAVRKEFESIITQLKTVFLKEHNEDGTHLVAVTPETIPVGGTVMWMSNTIPSKWLLCDGSQISRITYKSLFDIIGTAYGVGDGSLTFNLPNLKQRLPLGKAASGTGASLGDTGGAIDHTHAGAGGTTDSGGSFSTNTGNTNGDTGTPSTTIQLSAASTSPADGPSVATGGHTHTIPNHSHSVSVGGHSHTFSSGTTGANNPPYLVVNFIILAGV